MIRNDINMTPTPDTGVWSKFRLLLWKNFLLQKRHKWHTLIDIILPVLAFVLLAYIQVLHFSLGNKPTYYPPMPVDTLDSLWEYPDGYPPIEARKLVFYPNNTIFSLIMTNVSQKLKLDSPIGVNDVNSLEFIVEKEKLIAGVLFHHSSTIKDIPKDLSYSLRFPAELRTTQLPSNNNPSNYNWLTNLMYPENSYNSPRNLGYNDGGPPSYTEEGFLAIQNAIAHAFISVNGKEMPDIQVQRFPYPAYISNDKWILLQFIVPLFMLFSFNYTFMNTVRFVAIEKERQLKEAMKIMGLPNWIHWLSWFTRTMTMLTISVIMILVLLKYPWFGASDPVFPNSNIFLLGVFFIAYCISLITLSFFVSAFFSKAKAAATAATVVWYLSFIPFLMTQTKYDKMDGYLKVILCIFPNTAMGYGMKLIARNEEMGNGLIWSTLWRSLTAYDSLTIANIIFFMLFSSVLLMMMTMYTEIIFPGNYGVAKPWYFVFTKAFWYRGKNTLYKEFNNHNVENLIIQTEVDPGNFEEEPTNEHAGVETRNLCKMFGDKNFAVSNLSMKMFNNQITVLLGHNGAGKTTTFSMLTGMIEPTSGIALINGCDIRNDTKFARSSMGFCPQHNILFDELTVREHIMFYSCLKGLSTQAAKDEVRKYVRLLELESKVDELSQSLSGGMKRKLSVGIALCGNSKVVFCDEPTSGMDPASRRSLWNVLIEEKKNRVIVLSTHFMDEADVLGDRIAIMAHGELKCFGSSFFLKKRFGTGYHLICEKNDECHSDDVTQLLQKYLPDLQINSENESEIAYLLPENQVHLFKEVFTDLEQNESKLNIKSYGVSLTTMEEIFLKFGKDSVHSVNSIIGDKFTIDHSQAIEINSETHLSPNTKILLLDGFALMSNQVIAMLKKRFLCWLRSWKIFLFYNFLVFIILAPIVFEGFSFSKDPVGLPPLNISLDAYQKPITLVQQDEINNNNLSAKIIYQYQENIKTNFQKTEVLTTSLDLDSFILDVAKNSIQQLNSQYVAAISALSNGTILAWFNNQFYHTAPLALNLVHNGIIRATINSEYSIHVTNAPFKFLPGNATDIDEMTVSMFGMTFTMTLALLMSIVSSSYIMFYVKERVCRAKFMQYVSGINLIVFWITSILWDVLTSMITVVMIIIMLLLSQQVFWSDAKVIGVVSLLLLMFNFAILPIMCLASLIFSKPTTGVNMFTFVGIIISVVFFSNSIIGFMNSTVKTIFMAYPTCPLINGLFKLSTIEGQLEECELLCKLTTCDRQRLCIDSPACCPNLLLSWNKDSVSKDIVCMLITGIAAITILLLIEHGFLGRFIGYILSLRPHKLPPVDTEENPLDDDVSAIKERVNAMTTRELQENLILKNVSKFYGNFLAVNQVSLEIKQAECFGLLGNNGAGKTSIFKMLTGEERISSGDAFLHGLNLKSSMHSIYKRIGYCPQFDALFDDLTPRETLEIFAFLRGVPRYQVSSYAVKAATDLDFIAYIDKQVAQLSGGNKRKLSTAIALVGNPVVIFLDEPTTGMDPGTKRNLWNIINELRDNGKSIVLTSHSIEECEALCTQLTIMVNGNCKCYGSSQHLKNKFTKGFELNVKVKYESDGLKTTAVKEYIVHEFSGAILNEEHQGLLAYTIPSRRLKWSSVFGAMENGKRTQNIEDYSVCQNSLEQVFISFVKSQRGRNDQNET